MVYMVVAIGAAVIASGSIACLYNGGFCLLGVAALSVFMLPAAAVLGLLWATLAVAFKSSANFFAMLAALFIVSYVMATAIASSIH